MGKFPVRVVNMNPTVYRKSLAPRCANSRKFRALSIAIIVRLDARGRSERNLRLLATRRGGNNCLVVGIENCETLMKTLLSSSKLTRPLLFAATATALFAGCTAAPAQTETPDATTAQAPAQAATPPQVGDSAPDFELTSLSGDQIKLSDTLAQGPVVLVMLRGYPGYQCPICTAQVGGMINKAKQLQDAGANVLLVYPGPADGLKARAAEFVQGKDIPANFNLLLDPDYEFTNLYGLRWEAQNETSYPSTFVLDKDGKVLFAKVSREHGDRAKIADVIAALPAN